MEIHYRGGRWNKFYRGNKHHDLLEKHFTIAVLIEITEDNKSLKEWCEENLKHEFIYEWEGYEPRGLLYLSSDDDLLLLKLRWL